ncbi:hypothetical protein ALQ20_103424 [Pseudomonas syringae pv. atrofaciens]|nr:hypothetical protein ALQ20_103424 [Pseudomonas syringae pv. atrofaciens]
MGINTRHPWACCRKTIVSRLCCSRNRSHFMRPRLNNSVTQGKLPDAIQKIGICLSFIDKTRA